MAKTIPDMVRITLNTSNLQDRDSAGNPLGTYKGVLKNLDSDLSAFERALQSATNSFDFFNSNLKRIDPKSGLAEQSFYIRREEFDNAYKALKAKSAELASRRGGDYAFGVHAVENIEMTKTIYGKRAQKKAMEEVDRLGGVATVNASNPDKLDISIPYDKSALAGLNKRQRSALISQAIPEAMKLSDIERDQRKKDKEYKEAEIQKKEQDAKDKESVKKATAITKAILAVVTVIGDIVRRILTASLKQATENNKMAVEAHSVGVTALERRGYDIFDVAHGMEKGSTFGAIQSVQGMFGDVTNLDEKALGTLARVMGSEVSSLVRSGMGGQNPDQLLDKILDKYFKQFLSGKNSLGQSVGMEQARRELVTSLQSVSPEIAKLFARMADDYTSGYYGRFGGVAEWRDTTQTNRTGLTEANQKFSTEIGKKYNEIIAIVEDLKTSFFTRLSTSMDGLLTKVKNMRIGQSEENKIEEDIRNKQKNEESKAIMQNQLKLYNATSAEKIKELGSLENTPLNKGTTETQAKRFQYTAELLAGIQSGIYDEKYFTENNISGTGMFSAKEAKAYVARGKAIADNAMFNAEVQDEIARSVVNLQQIEKIKEANKNEIGSGKIADLSMTEAKQTLYAQEYAEKWGRSIAGRTGTLSTFGSEQQKVVQEAYFDYLMANPDVYQNELKSMNKNTEKAFTQNAKRIAKEKGINNLKDLSHEDKVRAFSEANAEWWYALNFIPSQYMQTKGSSVDTFLMNRAGIDARNNLNMADSKILSLLAQQNATLSPNKSYNISGSQGQSGEYVLKLQMLDSSGRETGQPISMTFSDTKGRTGDLGKVTTDSKGNVVYATTN